MSYTNTWTNVLPLGSQQASTADDEFRKLRLDIFERMNSLVVSWADDPVVLKPSVIAGNLPAPLAGAIDYTIPPIEFRSLSGTPTITESVVTFNASAASAVVVPIRLLPESTLLNINVYGQAPGAPLTVALKSITGVGSVATVNTFSTGSGTFTPATSGALNLVVPASTAYWLTISQSIAGGSISMVELFYTIA